MEYFSSISMQKQNTITFFHTEATQFLEKVSRFTASKWISIMAESNWIVRCLENNYEDLTKLQFYYSSPL